MKPRSLILLVAAILFFAVILFLKGPQRVVVASYALPEWELPIDTARVLKIAMKQENGPITLEKVRGIWRYERSDLPVADSVVTRLLIAIADFRLLGLVSSNPRKRDLFEVGETGMPIVITMEQGKEVSLVVGKMSSLHSRSYIRPTSSDMVFLASGLTSHVLRSEESTWRKEEAFHHDVTLVLSMSIETRHGKHTIHRHGSLWVSREDPIPSWVMSPVVEVLKGIRTEGSAGTDAARGQKPILSVEIQEQTRERFEFYPTGPNGIKYIMRTSITPSTYFVGLETAEPFLQLANFVSSREYSASQSRVGSLTTRLSSRESVVPRQQISTGKNLPVRDRVALAQPVSSQLQEVAPENAVDSKTQGSVEDDGVLSVHTVRPGETLESVALLYGTTADKLKQWNLLTGTVLSAGTELYVFVRK